MDQPGPSDTSATTPATSKRIVPNLERAVSQPFGRYSPPSSASSANTLDSSSRPFALPLRPTPSTAVRSVLGVGSWGTNASPDGFAGPVTSLDNPPAAFDSSPEMVLRAAAPAAPTAAASASTTDDPYEFGNSFLFGEVGQDDSNSDGGAGNGNARKMAEGASSERGFGTALDHGDPNGHRSRFFGQPSDESSGGVSGAAADPTASQASSSAEVSLRADATKPTSAATGGIKPCLASPFGRAPDIPTGEDKAAGNRHDMFLEHSRGSADVGATAGAGRHASGGAPAGWTGQSTLYEADIPEGGRDSGSAAWSSEGSKWSNDDGGGGDDDGDGEAQLKGARMQGLLACPGYTRFRLGDKEKERSSTVAPDASGQRVYSAVEQQTMCLNVDGGSRADGDDEDDVDDDCSGFGGGFRLPDAETDTQESRAKTAQRQQWIQRKDAAMTKFRRDCETEVARIKSAVEDHVREMENMLDDELIQALDGFIAEKIEDNHREKARARKIENLMSAFFCDPRVPKAQRVA